MLQTTIVSILEPRTYSLDASSLSWALTAGLKDKSNHFTLTDSLGGQVGQLVGLVPLLQIVPTNVDGRAAFLFFMKGIIDVTVAAGTAVSAAQPNVAHSLLDAHQTAIGAAYLSPGQQQGPSRLLVLQPTLADVETQNVLALQALAAKLTTALWPYEPIQGTTHNLYLAPNGEFLNRRELANSRLAAAELTVGNGVAQLIPGLPVPRISFKRWSGAGHVNLFNHVAALASGSCSDSSSSSSGSIGDSGGGGSGGSGS